MKQKTIKLDSDQYSLINGIVHFLGVVGEYNYEEPWENELRWVPSKKYLIGSECILVSYSNESPNALRSGDVKDDFSLVFRTDGIPGNMNKNIVRYHGWRGTTCETGTYAHGLREIIKVGALKNGTVTVTVGPDLLPDEE